MPLLTVLQRARARLAARLQPEATPPSAKASLTGPLVAFESLRRPVWTPHDYAAFAREGFMQNAVVYRSVRMIAEAAGAVPLLLYAGDREIERHPALDLLRRPSPLQTGPDLIETLVGHLLVSGNAYLEAVAIEPTGADDRAGASPAPGARAENWASEAPLRSADAKWASEAPLRSADAKWASEAPPIRELYVLRPDRMKVVPGPDGWPEAYDYTLSGRSVRLAGEAAPGIARVLHLRLFHPDHDHYGLSPLEAAATAIDLHNTAARWNKALLDNSARPSGALVYTSRDGNLSAEQYERLKAELESGFQGAANAGRPLLLEGGLDWKSMSLTPKDLDFIESRHAAAREIALALGVPPMLLGIPGDNTYANMAEAQRMFWRQTVLPLVNRIAAQLSGWLFAPGAAWSSHLPPPRDADGPLQLRPNLDEVEALTPERDALWSRLEKASFLTLNEKRAAAGYGPLEGPEAVAAKSS